MDRRSFLQHLSIRGTGLAALGGAAALGGYAHEVEPYWLEIVTRTLPVASLPAALDGARLALLSDLHVGPRVRDSYLADVFDRVRQHRPEIVVLGGDAITYGRHGGEAQFQHLRAVLAGFPRGRLATVAVLGNHDYGSSWQEPDVAGRVTGELERVGVRVLRNDAVNVAGLDLVGVEDLWSMLADAPRALAARTGEAAVAICHNPDGADELDWGDFRGWILAGHTHGGQCRPPFLPPPLLPVRNRRYSAGAIDAPGGRTLYISRGVGHILQLRFNVRPEVTVFTLRRA
ncbi:MAG TPA: metallophosphoesterase [Gemmatirosa sp.]